MAYSKRNQVKEILHIDLAETKYDAELVGCIGDADAWIDDELKIYTSVPLSTVPAIIVYVSKYRAAALFKEKEETEKAYALYQRFHARASQSLEKYIQNTFFVGKMRSD